MKVIFIKDYEKIKKGTTKEVSDGYAKNFLIAKGYAIQATADNSKKLVKQEVKQNTETNAKLEELKAIASIFSGTKINLVKPGTPKGTMRNALTKEEVVYKMVLHTGIPLDKKDVVFETTQKFGTHTATVKFGMGVTAEVNLTVVSD